MNKKIMYFADFPLSIGGANKVLLTQANIMQKKGYQVLIVIPNTKENFHIPEYDLICREYGLKIITAQFPIATCMEQIEILEVIEKYDEIKKVISNYEPDLIHSTQLNIAVELAARELGIPHLMNIYQTDEQEFMMSWMDIYPQYHSADSSLFSQRWGNGLGIMSRCIRVAYNGKENQLQIRKQNKEEQINIISIGVLCERKNQMEIIKFILECKKHGQSVKLTLLGKNDRTYGDECKRFVEENGLQSDVIFAGFVLDIEDYLNKADLFILASTVESYPGVIVESMANKVPIISTPVAGVPELLKDAENGFLTSGYKAEDIYQTFSRYQEYKKRGQISHIIEKAYSTYLEHHTYSVIGNQLDQYYQWIMKCYHKEEKSFVGVAQIKSIFDKYISDKKLGAEQPETICSIWYLYHVFLTLEKKDNKKIVIWGAGMWGKLTLDWIRQLGDGKFVIIGFIDENKQGEYLGYPIMQNKDTAIEESGTIFVAVASEPDRLEIMADLDRRGKVRNKDYFMTCNAPVRI